VIDLRFPTALQMMLTLAYAEEQGRGQMTSAQLATGLGSTASLVRKLLVPLRESGLIVSALGKTGGVRLARKARAITLREIYRSVTEEKKLFAARPDVPHLCIISSNVEHFFEGLAGDAEAAVLGMLGRRTLHTSLQQLLALQGGHPERGSALKPGSLGRASRT